MLDIEFLEVLKNRRFVGNFFSEFKLSIDYYKNFKVVR